MAIRKNLVKQIFDQLNQRMMAYLSNEPSVKPLLLWYGCPVARWDHQCKQRVFAHTNHFRGIVCVCEEIAKLHKRYVYGIIAHEFGHELAMRFFDSGSEESADDAAEQFLDLKIQYGSSLNLEFITKEEIESLQEI